MTSGPYLYEADDENDDAVPVAPLAKKEKTRGKKFRKRSKTQDDTDDEVVKNGSNERRVRSLTSHDEDDGSESEEEERLHDRREREELERHIRERYRAGTREMTERKLTKKGEEEAIRRFDALENDGIGTLRKVTRQEYLRKREQKKLDELRDDIEYEQYLFGVVKLTEAEYRELRYKNEIYELVKKRTEESGYTNECRMPDAYDQEGGLEKRFAVALQRIRDPADEEKMMNPFAEQEA